MAETGTDDALPGLSRFCESNLAALLSAVSEARLLASVEKIVSHDRWNSFDRFHETNQFLKQAYESHGVKAEIHTIPTGGKRGTGKWIIPEAEDIRSAALDIVEPIKQRVLDYQTCPWHVTQWSDSTPKGGVTCELIAIDSLDSILTAPPGTLAGKLVVTRLNPQVIRTLLCQRGAVGVLFDGIVEGCPDAVAWTKFGWGGFAIGEASGPLIGLAISSVQGDELRAMARERDRVIVQVDVDVARYQGTHAVVSGLIPGREDPDSEIWAVAHSAEPGALDNASGVAACVEIAAVLNGLIASGHLTPPRRTIRLLHGYECYGFFHFLEHAKRLQPPLAGVCIDTIGARPGICGGTLRWHRSATGSAGFADDIGAAILQAALGLKPVYQLKRMPFLSTEDTLLGDPKYGFPCPWITNHPAAGYHSSRDTIDLVDPEGLAVCTAAMAGYLYFLASAGTNEAIEIGREQTARCVTHVGSGKSSAIEVQSIRQEHQSTIDRLRRMAWTGHHSRLAAQFDEMIDRVERSSPLDVSSSHSVSPSAFRSRAARIPIRRMPLAPTPENVEPEVRERLGASFPKWAIFRADGERSLAEIAQLVSLDADEPLELEQIVRHFEALAELGYVDLVDPAEFLTEEQLVTDLAALGLRPGMDVIVHSSMRSIGPVRGGAESVVRALLSILGPTGTLLAPSFNHFAAKVFNPLTTPTTNGAIANAIWRRRDALRSVHPSHSVAAIGPRAAGYLRDHLKHGIWSAQSPIGQLIEAGGYILSIGVGHDRSTAYHLEEISLGVPCLDSSGSIDRIVHADGHIETVKGLAWRDGECPVDPSGLDALLEGVQIAGTIGRARATLVRAAEVASARRTQLGDRCRQCGIRPQPRNV